MWCPHSKEHFFPDDIMDIMITRVLQHRYNDHLRCIEDWWPWAMGHSFIMGLITLSGEIESAANATMRKKWSQAQLKWSLLIHCIQGSIECWRFSPSLFLCTDINCITLFKLCSLQNWIVCAVFCVPLLPKEKSNGETAKISSFPRMSRVFLQH